MVKYEIISLSAIITNINAEWQNSHVNNEAKQLRKYRKFL